MFDLLNVWKPRGPSSYDVIRHVRRCVGRKVKVGHAGTLDPLAEGVLVVCLGRATRLADLVHSYPKHYVTLARLGAVSDTDDAEGEIRPVDAAAAPSAERVREVLTGFVGMIPQVPPAHSAVKVAGQRAYKMARAGEKPHIAPRTVTVHSLRMIDYEYPSLRLAVACGSGTYIRSLVRDIGEKLGVGGYCEEIVRESIGPFDADNAARVDLISAETIDGYLIRPVEAVPPAMRISITEEMARELAHGRAVEWANTPVDASGEGGQEYPLLGAIDPQGRLTGLVRPDRAARLLRPDKIFIPTA